MRGGTRRLGTGMRATQASPPTSSATPAPTGTKALPKRHDKKPPPESGSGVEWGGDACVAYKYRFFAGPASQAEGEHALDMCSNAFSGGFRGSLSKKPILVSRIRHPRPYGDERAPEAQPQIPIPESASATPAPTGKPGFFLLHLTLIVLAFGWAHT